MKTNTKQEFGRCVDCGMPERMEWFIAQKHVCNTVTDPNYEVIETTTFKIGKRRFVKVNVPNNDRSAENTAA